MAVPLAVAGAFHTDFMARPPVFPVEAYDFRSLKNIGIKSQHPGDGLRLVPPPKMVFPQNMAEGWRVKGRSNFGHRLVGFLCEIQLVRLPFRTSVPMFFMNLILGFDLR